MNEPIDSLQIKIDKAKMTLPEETRRAIDAVDLKSVILGMRESKGYTFEQLGDLETETELLLCGLLKPEDYPKELQKRMELPRVKVNELVDEMNQLVFGKIREELIKIGEQKKTPTTDRQQKVGSLTTQINKDEARVLDKAGIEIINTDLSALELSAPEKPTENNNAVLEKAGIKILGSEDKPRSILSEKLSDSYKTPAVKTEHSLGNISKSAPFSPAPYPPKADPYRLSPE